MRKISGSNSTIQSSWHLAKAISRHNVLEESLTATWINSNGISLLKPRKVHTSCSTKDKDKLKSRQSLNLLKKKVYFWKSTRFLKLCKKSKLNQNQMKIKKNKPLSLIQTKIPMTKISSKKNYSNLKSKKRFERKAKISILTSSKPKKLKQKSIKIQKLMLPSLKILNVSFLRI